MDELLPDFDALASAAKAAFGSADLGPADRLWAAVFRQSHWLFLVSPKSVEQLAPSVQLIEGKSWLLAFTDSEHLQKYAVLNRNLDAKGNTLYLSLPIDGAMPFLVGYREAGVFGVRFNEGAAVGFWAPMRNLELFPRYLREKGYGPAARS